MLERLRAQLGAQNDADLARKIGMNKSEVSKILNGQRESGMRLATLAQISDAVGIGFLTLAAWWNDDGSTPC